jgi:hypothetical protein
MGKEEMNGMDSRSWTFTEKQQWMKHWRFGNLGTLDSDDEHRNLGQFKEVVWRV